MAGTRRHFIAWTVSAGLASAMASCGTTSVESSPDGSALPAASPDASMGQDEADEASEDGADGDDAGDGSVDAAADLCPLLDAFAPSAPLVPGCTLRLRLYGCDSPYPCLLSPDEVACDASSDCTTFVNGEGCGCGAYVVGVNTRVTPRCAPRLCPPPPPPLDGGPNPCLLWTPSDASGSTRARRSSLRASTTSASPAPRTIRATSEPRRSAESRSSVPSRECSRLFPVQARPAGRRSSAGWPPSCVDGPVSRVDAPVSCVDEPL